MTVVLLLISAAAVVGLALATIGAPAWLGVLNRLSDLRAARSASGVAQWNGAPTRVDRPSAWPGYHGQERRHHRVLITENTEYHMRDRLCVAVRTEGEQWQPDHLAVGTKLIASVKPNGGWVFTMNVSAMTGCRLCFSSDIMTSPVRAIRRPERALVSHYRAA